MHCVEKLVEVTSTSMMCWPCSQREEMVYKLERDTQPLMDATKDQVDDSHCPSRWGQGLVGCSRSAKLIPLLTCHSWMQTRRSWHGWPGVRSVWNSFIMCAIPCSVYGWQKPSPPDLWDPKTMACFIVETKPHFWRNSLVDWTCRQWHWDFVNVVRGRTYDIAGRTPRSMQCMLHDD